MLFSVLLFSDSIYGICRERRENLNIRNLRNYSCSKLLARKPYNMYQPDHHHHHQQHIIIRIHLVVWRPMFRSHCYLQQWFSKYWSLWICAKDQKVQQIHDNHQNDTMTMTIMMMLTSWSYWWHQDDTITMTTMTIITNHEKPHNHDDDTRTMTIMTIPTILTSWSPRLAAALQMESHHRSWPSMYSSHWCLYMYLKVYLKG